MKYLIVMRHAKAASPPHVDDHERPLEKRGFNDAAEAAGALVSLHIEPQTILVSDALRTKQTYEAIKSAFKNKYATTITSDLYQASLDEVLHVLDRAAKDTTSLMVIGHNPTMEHLVATLAAQPIPMSTANICVFENQSPAQTNIASSQWQLLQHIHR